MVIHHLRDTEEQRNFNDTYYERWGFDLNGEMKYAVMITHREHVNEKKREYYRRKKERENVGKV